LDLMERQLTLHEGVRNTEYLDTQGNVTILCGNNLDARGWDFIEKTLGRKINPAKYSFTKAEAALVLRADIWRIEKIVAKTWPHYETLSDVRKRVVIDMAFNLGRGVLNFRRAKAAMEASQWSTCARELYKSQWAVQVDDGEGGRFGRADRLVAMVLTNTEPTDPEWVRFAQAYTI
jgi:lysozyme